MKKVVITLLFLWMIGGTLSFVSAEDLSPSSDGAQNNTLKVEPISPEDSVVKLEKMEKDIQQLGEGLAPNLSKYALVAGAVMIVIGLIFSKKVMIAGFAMIGIAFLIYFLIGDMNKTMSLIEKIVDTLKSYF